MNTIPGLCYAQTEDGLTLPVIDVSHPAFAIVEMSQADLDAEREKSLQRAATWSKVPRFIGRLLTRRSVIMRNGVDASGAFFGGMATYMMKLGPACFEKRIDRRLAASHGAIMLRLRLRNVARSIADGLSFALAARPSGPVYLLNIAGGPAADSLNALLLIRKEHPEWLQGRPIHIQLLDLHHDGPRFAARALAALLFKDAPLHGLNIILDHVHYDWKSAARLRELLPGYANGAVVAGSSEGGLFDYGSDEEIVANLEAIRAGTPHDFVMVGDVPKADEHTRRFQKITRIPIRYFELDAFGGIARRAGWIIGRVVESHWSYVVTLKRH